ncbi:Phage integrase, N-terminal [Marinobacter sp. DSM 26671]|nr:Phage integrase, N-terminal [Marinobacter sp. DSM 26671]
MNIRDITKNIKWHEEASTSTKSRTVRRIQTMADAIEAQFPAVRYCNQIKLKHMEYLKYAWFDNEGFAPSTMADYTRAMRLMIKALGKDRHWFGHLGLVQDPTRGGRRVVSRVTKTRSRNRR